MSDDDAVRYIKIFTFLSKEEIETLTEEHTQAPHKRILQRKLAEEMTILVHSEEDYKAAVEASEILFGNGTAEALKNLPEELLLAVMEGVPQFTITREAFVASPKMIDICTELAPIFPSKGELRKLIKSGGVSLNKEKVGDTELLLGDEYLIAGRYLLVQKGKKQYYLLTVQ